MSLNNNITTMSNLNTKSLTDDYLMYRLMKAGYTWQNGPTNSHPTRVKQCLRLLGDEFEQRYRDSFTEMANHIHITPANANRTFAGIVNELFSDDVKWGRIVALFAFSGALAAQSVEKGLPGLVDDISLWVANYVDKNLSAWISQHGGWDGFVKFYETGDERRYDDSTWPTFNLKTICSIAAVGVLTLGAMFVQKS